MQREACSPSVCSQEQLVRRFLAGCVGAVYPSKPLAAVKLQVVESLDAALAPRQLPAADVDEYVERARPLVREHWAWTPMHCGLLHRVTTRSAHAPNGDWAR